MQLRRFWTDKNAPSFILFADLTSNFQPMEIVSTGEISIRALLQLAKSGYAHRESADFRPRVKTRNRDITSTSGNQGPNRLTV
jgi:hypothetical protein